MTFLDILLNYIEYKKCFNFYKNRFDVTNIFNNYNIYLNNNFPNPENKCIFRVYLNFSDFFQINKFRHNFYKNNFMFAETFYNAPVNLIIKYYFCPSNVISIVCLENLENNFWTVEKMSNLRTPTNWEKGLGYMVDNNFYFPEHFNFNNPQFKNYISLHTKIKITEILIKEFDSIKVDLFFKCITSHYGINI